MPNDKEESMRAAVISICDAIQNKNFDPVRQIVEYLLSEDPTYLPDAETRTAIQKIDRNALLADMLRVYIAEDPTA